MFSLADTIDDEENDDMTIDDDDNDNGNGDESLRFSRDGSQCLSCIASPSRSDLCLGRSPQKIAHPLGEKVFHRH